MHWRKKRSSWSIFDFGPGRAGVGNGLQARDLAVEEVVECRHARTVIHFPAGDLSCSSR